MNDKTTILETFQWDENTKTYVSVKKILLRCSWILYTRLFHDEWGSERKNSGLACVSEREWQNI